MKMLLFDFECPKCLGTFEELARHGDDVRCPRCGTISKKLVTGTHLDGRMGIDAESFPTMGDKWERKQRQRKAIELKRKLSHGEA